MKMLTIVCSRVLLAIALTTAPQAQHTVLLTWIGSTDAASNPSLTYNVYRSTSCSGVFAPVSTSTVAATTFTDASVFDGETYCYQVTAVLSGVESIASNQATAVIPAAPVTPSSASSSSSASKPTDRNNCTRHGPLANWLKCVAALPRAHK